MTARRASCFPQIAPAGYLEAVRRALVQFDGENVETAWSDALTSSHLAAEPVVLTTQEGMMLERRQLIVHAIAGTGLRGVQLARRRDGLAAPELGLAAARLASTGWSAASACGEVGAIRTTCGSATPWTSGASRRSSPAGSYACAPR